MSVSPSKQKPVNFAAALNLMLRGSRVRRLSWTDSRIFLTIANERLSIFKPEDNQLHPLIVTTGDITATDWVMCRQEIKNV